MRENILRGIMNLLKQELPEFTHLIGVKKAVPQSEYPFLSYVYAGEEPSGNKTELRIHLYFGIFNNNIRDDAFEGHIEILNLIERIKRCLYYNRLFAEYVLDSYVDRVATDGGLQHPRYEAEMVVKVIALDIKPEQEYLTTRITFLDKDDVLLSDIVKEG